MSEQYENLKKEMRANFELTWGYQTDTNKRLSLVEGTVGSLSQSMTAMKDNWIELAQNMSTISKKMNALAEDMGAAARTTVRLVDEVHAVAESNRRVEGQMKHQSQRFDLFMRAMEQETPSIQDIIELEVRIETRLAEIERRLSA